MIRAGIDTSNPMLELVGKKANSLPKGYIARVVNSIGECFDIINAGPNVGLVNIKDLSGGNSGAFTACTITQVLGKLIIWELPE